MTWRSQNGRFRTKSGEQKPAANGTLSVAEPGTAIQSLSLEHELGKIQEVQDRSPLANLPSPARLRRGTWGGEHPENFAASLAQGVDDETISAKMSYREKLRANGEQALQRTRNRGAVSPKSAPVLPDNTFDLTPKGSAQMTPHGAGSPFLTNFGMIAGQTQASPHMVSWHESAAPFWQAPHIIEVDYKAFLDFALALGNKHTTEALQYFWKLLDIYHKGYIDGFVIKFFYRAVGKTLRDQKADVPSEDDVLDEIFDMVKPSIPDKITLQDLVNCQQGGTVVSMLFDAAAFWRYDNRENQIYSLLQENQNNGENDGHDDDELNV